MNADLAPVVAALADLDDGELAALIATVNGVPQFAPGLLAWIEGACDWEQNRRRGLDFPLQPPEAAIDPSEDGVSIDAAVMMRVLFAQDDTGGNPAVVLMRRGHIADICTTLGNFESQPPRSFMLPPRSGITGPERHLPAPRIDSIACDAVGDAYTANAPQLITTVAQKTV